MKTQSFPTVIVEGLFSINGHSEMIADLVSQSFWKPGMNLLIDDRKVEFSGTNLDLLRVVSENFRSFEEKLGNGKVAILMDSLTDYARGRQFELLTDYKMSTQLRAFMDEEKALNWLKSP